MDPIKQEKLRREQEFFRRNGYEKPPVGDAKTDAVTIESLIKGADAVGAGRLIGLDDDETLELMNRTQARRDFEGLLGSD